VFTLTLLIAESINKDGMTYAFHLRTRRQVVGARVTRRSNSSDAVNIAQVFLRVTKFVRSGRVKSQQQIEA